MPRSAVSGRARREATGLWAAALIAGLALSGLGGCSPAAGAAGAGAGTSCGTTRTAAGAVVTIEVVKGPVDCADGLRAEAAYAAAIRDGGLRGNGGGAPVTVDGWTCESYPAPQALRTGNASTCHTAKAVVVAVLSLSSAAPPATEAAGS